MTAGVQRGDTQYVWPPGLDLPPADTQLVYLDLNHWIGLAKAATGHRNGGPHRDALDALRRAKSSGRFVFPLSSTHFMEMAGISSQRQRFDVAEVMEELSEFDVLVSRSVVMRCEIEAVLDDVARKRPFPYLPVPLVGHGVLQAFGMQGGMKVRNAEGEDVTEQARLAAQVGPEEFDRRLAEAETLLDRSVLRGPTDEEEPELAADGWDPTVARTIAEERALGERQQAENLDRHPSWRHGRLRDVVSGRHMLIELNKMIMVALAARGLELEDVWTGPIAARQLMDSMPSSDVCVTLMVAAHRNRETRWTANDMFDIDGLSIAVPYCDAVLTEKHARQTLRAAKVPVRAGTNVFARPEELVAWLESRMGSCA